MLARSRNMAIRMLSLPVELEIQIIDEIGKEGDITIPRANARHLRTLSSCSLVCKSWLDSSRVHLFRFIYLRDVDDFHVLCEAFNSGSSHLKELVRGIHVEDNSVASRAATHLIPLLPNLSFWRSASLKRSASLLTFTPRDQISLKSHATITSLCLDSVVLDKSTSFLTILSSFPSLSVLRVMGVVGCKHDDREGVEWTANMRDLGREFRGLSVLHVRVRSRLSDPTSRLRVLM